MKGVIQSTLFTEEEHQELDHKVVQFLETSEFHAMYLVCAPELFTYVPILLSFAIVAVATHSKGRPCPFGSF